jgi:O-antigen/teichoic acid export membrane protein
LNWWFVPKFGILGAALATLMASFIWVFTTLVVSQIFWKIGFNYRVMFFQLGIVASCLIIQIFYFDGQISPVSTLLCTVSVVVLALSCKLNGLKT